MDKKKESTVKVLAAIVVIITIIFFSCSKSSESQPSNKIDAVPKKTDKDSGKINTKEIRVRKKPVEYSWDFDSGNLKGLTLDNAYMIRPSKKNRKPLKISK